jgi:lipoprotein-releasing system permease protein
MTFFKKYEFIIAWRYLMSKRREGGISIIAWYALIGVVLGVATLVIVQAVMIGFRIEFVEKIIGANSHLAIYKKTLSSDLENGFYVEEVQNILQDLKNKKNFKAAYPLVKDQVLASKSNNSAGVEVHGIRKGDLINIELVNKPTSSEGSMENFNDGVAIGAHIARKLNISINDTIKLISPNGAKSVFGTIPRVNVYEVKYIFSVGRYDIDSTRIYMPIKDAQVFFNRANQADLIEVLLNNPFDVDEFKNNLEDELAERYLLWSWKERTAAFLDALDLERRVMFIILSLIVLIAAMNIISGLVMLVKNKGRDIGILRSLGLTRSSILRVFFICGSLIGVVGTVLGVIIGILFVTYINEIQWLVEYIIGSSVWNEEIRFLTQVPAKLRIEDVVFALLVSLSISFVITIFPARKAASLDPAEALKYE